MMSLKASGDGSSAVKALAGPAQVDMNKYNLPFEEAEQQRQRLSKKKVFGRGTIRPCLSTLSRLSSRVPGQPLIWNPSAGVLDYQLRLYKAIPLSRWQGEENGHVAECR
jgi:hypothetical protein